MKGQLFIGDDVVAETVEVVSPPRAGDLVIFQGKRLRVREIGHNVDKKKLQIMCHVPPQPASPEETWESVQAEADKTRGEPFVVDLRDDNFFTGNAAE